MNALVRDAFGGDYYRRALHFLFLQIALLAVLPVLGHYISLIGFVILYLLVWGRYHWRWTLVYAACSTAVLYLLYDRALHVPWIDPFFMG